MPLFIRLNPVSCNASPQLVQLMNIVSNLIFHCNNCDANRAFVTVGESTAAATSSGLVVVLNAKFTFKGTSPPIIFARIVRPMNALQLCRWHFLHKETLQQTFSNRSAILNHKRPFYVFERPLDGLGATYDDYLRLIGKRVVDFLLVLIELFSLCVTAESLWANIDEKIGNFAPTRSLWRKISVKGIAPINHAFS